MNLLYIDWNVNPEIFNILGIPVKYYGLLFLAGLVLCFNILKSIYKKENLSMQAHESLFSYALIGILVGARLGHCIFYDFDYYSQHILEIFLPIQKGPDGVYHFVGFAGLASHGGGIGLVIMLLLYSRKFSIPFMKVLDAIAIVLPLGGVFIRLANLMNSEIIGTPTNVPWAFIFRQVDDLPRHPAQLYEAISYFVIFLLIYFIYKKDIFKIGKGFYFGISILLIFIMRILIEFIKVDQVEFEHGMSMNMGQLLSIPFVLLGLFFIGKSILEKSKMKTS
ncbi:prolipoprotein diacylglyceryl transferase [Chryseobacterium joostei]|uniref:Phosphatidylglycerol--prolipoprotein diacylglyceryl transferase n=2 Tax=Chryseobacterium TaxID=59732 RepID=A0A1N7IC99_9FLAO|nr:MULTISPECIES: prolipoprotein diacylglyceryl transferase [Chryseobacterium]AZB01899.1 prolipoprotein diacylglyceryl transferase [Chryseobacterium joostei]PWN66578.1 prolipoprotein diacylglyceryl transferase [Chryseobacterium oncorhynchi]SIS34694.1 Prolipoprotein diacylglyceryl transferase [Chryseobacterium joostei]HCM36236.1 prolipoprotein diacylglyceryl transferase [Chryseobacterium sp.]